MKQKIINKAKKMLANADTGTNDCKNYNNGFMDGVKYAIKALLQPHVSGSLLNDCVYYNLSDRAMCPNKNVCVNCQKQ